MNYGREMTDAEKLESVQSYSQLPVQESAGTYEFTVFDEAHRSEKKLCSSFDEAISFALGIYSGRRLEVAERAKSLLMPITQERYTELLLAENELERLQANGVDNWEGYGEC
jgi:hypothetical protein